MLSVVMATEDFAEHITESIDNEQEPNTPIDDIYDNNDLAVSDGICYLLFYSCY